MLTKPFLIGGAVVAAKAHNFMDCVEKSAARETLDASVR